MLQPCYWYRKLHNDTTLFQATPRQSEICHSGWCRRKGWPISAGITEADQWRLTTDLTGDQEPIASNLERNDSTGFSLLGTGMTQSSGIFTFPSTGYWYITAQFAYTSDVIDNQKTGNILITTNNSTYATGATCVANFYSSSTLATMRQIDAGQTTLQADPGTARTALGAMQTVAQSEYGAIYEVY